MSLAGLNVNSDLVPNGATIAIAATSQIAGLTTVTLGGLTTSQIAGITAANDPAALFVGTGITPEATVNLERTFDQGATWITAGVGGGGSPASFPLGAASIPNNVSVVGAEPEKGVAYRLHVVSFSGTVPCNYRISASGLAAMAWGFPVG